MNKYSILPIDTNDDFAYFLREILWKKGISQTKFSEMTGISLPTINGYLLGRSSPSLKTLLVILKSLNYSMEFVDDNK